MIDYQVRLVDFPRCKSAEAVTKNADGSYTIFIDARLTREKQRENFLHAMQHICCDDFEKSNVDKIEFKAHR